jgi:TolB protein
VGLVGGEPEHLVRFPARIHGLCCSADGKALYASTELGGIHNDIWRIVLSDPERPTKITFGQADEDRPSVSTDGRRLLYSDNHEGCPALVLLELGASGVNPEARQQALIVDRLDFGVLAGRLSLDVRDKATGQPLIARVAIEHQDGSFYAPPGGLWRVFGDVVHFYVRGRVELDLPAGTYRIRAWHGPEYGRAESYLEVSPGKTAEQTVLVQRWTDPNARGWYSGENHIHANYGYGEYYNSPATMAEICAGEGLSIANLMVANSDGDGVFDREFFRGRPDPLSTRQSILYWNEEYRSTIWGHMTLVNLKQVVEPVFTGFKDTTNPYDIPTMSAIAERTHRQGGLVNYTHPASRLEDLYRGAYSAKGVPIHAALGQIDTFDVMGSGDQASTALYHRLLNCGFRLAASAGTDCFLNRTRSSLPGGERAYVKLDGPLTYEKWIAGLRAGRSFVTNGPMLELSVNGKEIGSVVNLAAAAEVHVGAAVSSQHPVERVEILFNGKVVATANPAPGTLPTKLDQQVPVERSGWPALRATGRYVPDVQGERLYAHTSPVYVVVAGKPAGSAEDARYFLKWIDRLWDAVQDRDRIPGERWKAEVQAEVDQARQVYRQIIARSEAK